MQAVEEQQEEAGDGGDGAADVADRDHARAVDPALLPDRLERHAVIGDVGAQHPANIELAAFGGTTAAAVLGGEPFGHAPDDPVHAGEVAGLEAAQARLRQHLVAQAVGCGHAVDLVLPFDESAGLAKQRRPRLFQGVGFGLRVRRALAAQRGDPPFQGAQAHFVEDTAGIDAALGEDLDVGGADLIGGAFHGGRDAGPVAAHHHADQVGAGVGGIGLLLIFGCLPSIRRQVAGEEQVEAVVEGAAMLDSLGEDGAERVLQDPPVA